MITLLGRFALVAGGSLPASIVVKATVIAALALIGTRLARGSRAAVRHVLLAAAFGVLLLLPLASVIAPPIEIAVRTVEQESAALLPAPAGVDPAPRLSSADTRHAAIPALSRSYIPSLSTFLLFAWLAGVALSVIPMMVGLREIRALRRTGLPWREGQALVDRLAAETGMAKHVEALLHESLPGPVASGALHPAILLPENAECWEREDLHRALVHELEHVRRGDVVVHSLARVVCSLYWFHPLVWMVWRHLTLEAERACDDAVLKGSEATAYADQLVALARKLLASDRSPLLAMANRSDLAIRVGAVLNSQQRRGRAGRFAVTFASVATIFLVLAVSPLRTVSGLQSAPSNTANLAFEVASIKLNKTGSKNSQFGPRGRRFVINNWKLWTIMAEAYQLDPDQITGGPAWMRTDKYDVDAEAGGEGEHTVQQWMVMIQKLLADRFQLKFHIEKKEMAVYAIVLGKGGPKMKVSTARDGIPGIGGGFVGQHEEVPAHNATVADLAQFLQSVAMDRPVVDQTGLTGRYDFTLDWLPDSSQFGGMGGWVPKDDGTPDIYAAMQEQLGLKLERTRALVDIYVIDHIEKPSEN